MDGNKYISIIGSTGSIGTQALSVAEMHGIKIKALAAGSNWKALAKQCIEVGAKTACIFNEQYADDLKNALSGKDVKVITGMDGLCEISADPDTDTLLNSVVGMIGLLPTLTAIENDKDIALANKETLVAGGELVMKKAAEKNVKIYPVDSEHSAIFQCLQGNKREQLSKIILTASGGPFFGKTLNELENVTIEQALDHPNWSMGNKITIDSATLMNKGLEFIEAKWLFDLEPEQIEIVVHRQSVVHSAVEYGDNSVIAQMGVPDMKIPIQYALLYPDRLECGCKPLSLTDYGKLTFEKPDFATFKCLSACIEAIKRGGAYPCIVNGANEEAVKYFLDGKIKFTDIGEIVSGALEKFGYHDINKYEDVIEFDKKAREYVLERMEA
ncbi:MAG: 1-deoxy-D-xylulose-5-phosphate reductoisomerase [Clostridium sp.]|nr:1-deoxy-D-xylulose-5-phosphate reductoisomerase [Clostridium sp.]MCM1547120.1 1-deoxy-D-xylulose-5-phosphate reductoisomerase [Ruminococcus sp.]